MEKAFAADLRGFWTHICCVPVLLNPVGFRERPGRAVLGSQFPVKSGGLPGATWKPYLLNTGETPVPHRQIPHKQMQHKQVPHQQMQLHRMGSSVCLLMVRGKNQPQGPSIGRASSSGWQALQHWVGRIAIPRLLASQAVFQILWSGTFNWIDT